VDGRFLGDWRPALEGDRGTPALSLSFPLLRPLPLPPLPLGYEMSFTWPHSGHDALPLPDT
jgi:hypothetical protein